MANNKILFSWLGNGDINNTQKKGRLSGAIAQALKLVSPDKLYLLNGQNYKELHWKDSVESYIVKLKDKFANENLIVQRVDNFNPIDYRNICSHLIPFLEKNYNPKDEFYFLQTSGTPSTAVVWCLLSQTRFRANLVQTSEENGPEVINLPFNVFADFIPAEQDHIITGISKSEYSTSKIVYTSNAMKMAVDMANRVALHDVPVLLLGESGTGKELFAKHIHSSSGRKGKIVTINCGAIPQDLFESELFGHEKGAYTGADKKRDGKYVTAQGGTLFLDEVGELTLENQVKLLRALQEGEIVSLGSDVPQNVDVRIIAATNRDLLQEVAEGRFREDLFYRLAVGVIQIPSLRERKNDALLIAEYILKKTNDSFKEKIDHYTVKKFNKSAKGSINKNLWRGNVRELENVIRRACIWNDTPELTGEHIQQAVMKIPDTQRADSIMERPIFEGFKLESILDEIEKHYIQRANKMSAGNKTEMERLLGFSRQTIAEKMKKFDIS